MLIAAFAFLLIAGCKKDDKTDTDTQSAVDNAFAQGIYDEVSTMSDQAHETGALYGYRGSATEGSLLSQCATVTIDTAGNPKHITIDFGTTNCACSDGRNRRGKVLVAYSGGYRDSASTYTISFDGYYVNDYHVEGTKTVTNKGTNSSGNKWFDINVNGTITSPGGQVLTWTSQRQREWVAGESTLLNWLDDVYHITGTASGTSFAGVSFSASITSPLVVALNCYWIKDGVLEFTPSGIQTRVINYGYQNGACDNKAEVTIGSNSYIIILR